MKSSQTYVIKERRLKNSRTGDEDYIYYAENGSRQVTAICGSREGAIRCAERGDWLQKKIDFY